MPKYSTHSNKNKGFEGGHYARTEEELYEKAIALLEKCKVEDRDLRVAQREGTKGTQR